MAAFACRPTFVSASWATRNSAASMSTGARVAVPAVSSSAGIPDCCDQPQVSSPSASASVAFSSCSGRSARTERRASVRLDRASDRAWARCRDHSAGRCRACSAASSWATIAVSPWASVSWISPASRRRSWTIPAARACSTSRACSAAFSAIDSSSRRFASASSPIIRPRSTFCSSAR